MRFVENLEEPKLILKYPAHLEVPLSEVHKEIGITPGNYTTGSNFEIYKDNKSYPGSGYRELITIEYYCRLERALICAEKMNRLAGYNFLEEFNIKINKG